MMGNSNSKMTDKSREEELMECVHNNTPEEEIDECLSNMDGDKAERSEGGEKESEPDHMMGPQGVSAFMPPEGCESVEGQDDSANMDCPQNNEGKHDGNVGNSSPHESMEVEEKSDTSKTESVEGQDDSANMDCPQKNEGKDDGNVGNSSPHESMEVEEKSEEKSMKEDSNGGEKEEKNEEIKSDLEPTNEARGEEKRGNVGDNTNPQRIDTEEMAAGNMSDEEDCAITPAEKNKNKGDNNGGEKEKTEENWDDTPTPAQPQKDYPKYVIPARKNGSPEAANSSEKNGAQQNGRAARPTSLDIPAANAFCFPANAPAQAVPVPKQRKHSNMLINIPQRPAKSISISHEAAEIGNFSLQTVISVFIRPYISQVKELYNIGHKKAKFSVKCKQ